MSRFSFCQYPFILSLAAKREILQRDSEQQMIVMARVGVLSSHFLFCSVMTVLDYSVSCIIITRYIVKNTFVSKYMNSSEDIFKSKIYMFIFTVLYTISFRSWCSLFLLHFF